MTDFLKSVETEAETIYAEVKSGLTYLEHEGQTVLAWIEREVPSAAPAIAAFLKGAEADAAELATYAANGLQSEIAAVLDGTQTQLLNLIQSTHLATNAQGALKAIDVSGVALVNSIAQKAVSVGLAQLLAKLAPMAVEAVAAVV